MNIKPKLNLFDFVIVVISLIIGIGIFRTPVEVASHTKDEFTFFMIWLTGGVICIMGGLTYAEIGARKPYSGGFYKILSEYYNPAFAFMINWLGVTVTAGATYAAISIVGSDYLSALLGSDFLNTDFGKKISASLFVIFVLLVNLSGIKTGSFVLNIFTVLKIFIIVLFAVLGLFINSSLQSPTPTTSPADINFFSGFSAGLIAALFSYNGYQLSINLAADVKNPKRNLPLGIIVGSCISIAIYLLLNFTFVKIAGLEKISQSPAIAHDIGTFIFGNAGGKIISFIIILSVLGFLNVSFLYLQRTFFAMAEDKVFPKSFMRMNSKTQAQEIPLIFITAITLFFIIFQGTFSKILNLIIFNDAMTIAIVASTIFLIRKRDKTYEGFKAPLYPVLPAVFILSLIYISINSFIQNPISGLLSIIFFLAGYPLYKFSVKINR